MTFTDLSGFTSDSVISPSYVCVVYERYGLGLLVMVARFKYGENDIKTTKMGNFVLNFKCRQTKNGVAQVRIYVGKPDGKNNKNS